MYGVCKICGCTENDPCYNPDHGFCWWVDDNHELCSHCAIPEVAEDTETVHCIASSECEMFDKDEYLVVNSLSSEGSPCDQCERRVCLGVDICEEEYGANSYFLRRQTKEEEDEF